MNNKLTGALLLSAAGLVAAIGTVGVQIAYALVLSGFYAGNMAGVTPPGPLGAHLHWLVDVAVIVLAVSGLFFLLHQKRQWELKVPLKDNMSQAGTQYVIHAYQRGNQYVAATFAFDISGPPLPSE
jgi:hypothetical protein